jgi:hypothetical protein
VHTVTVGRLMALDLGRTARGAFAGAVAAAVWAAQQPLDMKVFGVRYDDTELLGKFVTRGPAWRPIGVALHVLNGAAFGAVYANVAPSVSLPSWARGPAAGLLEHAASWPGTALLPAVHPASDDFPALTLDPRAFAQATWRHALFGVVLGELERRLNVDEEPEIPSYEHVASTNGHGDLEKALSGAGPQ